ncbi:hypothetical protein [Acetobacter okinawensis]|uniref:hypothetical protein n=1 Tax=Acetobacter okinawensis TaxID=1076594 RepID=UPI0015D7E1EA|nr:hypothetical protein [Acetobacter okinawensis]
MSGFRLYHAAMASALVACGLTLSPIARADDETAPRSNVNNIQLQKELAVLHFKPDAAGPACIDALKELHKTQDLLQKDEENAHNQDLTVAEDVLESDFENSIEACAADVEKMCESHNPSAELRAACEKIDSLPSKDTQAAD